MDMDSILKKFPEDQREPIRHRITDIKSKYGGFHLEVLSLIYHATRLGRYEVCLEKLDRYHRSTLKHIPRTQRRSKKRGSGRFVLNFFRDCCDSWGIDPNVIST